MAQEYVDFNTQMRQQAKNDFEKDHFKLMNNAVFGKTVENVRDYVNVRVVSNPNLFLKLCASPRYEQYFWR